MRMTPTTYGAFLSTLSLRRATGKLPKPLTDCVFLSTLSLRRATLTTVLHWYHISISIHALLAESDTRHRTRGAVYKISIHALLAESDKRRLPSSWRRNHFYPRSPCGERPGKSTTLTRIAWISIHALLAESDKLTMIFGKKGSDFYPRSPCGERQRLPAGHPRVNFHFYPRSPCGERL